MPNKTVPDSETIIMKQIVRLQGGICPEKCQLDQIQNDRLETIIDFNMGNIRKTVIYLVARRLQ